MKWFEMFLKPFEISLNRFDGEENGLKNKGN